MLLHRVEVPEPESSPSAENPFDVIIVLGGCTKPSPNGTPEVGCDGERVVSAAQAWHAGLTKKIITTGYASSGIESSASLAQKILISLGVPEDAIVLLKGENTLGEMREIQQYFGDSPPQRIGLITSSFHMSRATRLASGSGINVTPIPVAYRVHSDRGFRLRDLVPNGSSSADLALATKEILAEYFGR